MMRSCDWHYSGGGLLQQQQELPPWTRVGTRPGLLVLRARSGRTCVFHGSVPRDYVQVPLLFPSMPYEERQWWRYLLHCASRQGWERLGYLLPYLHYEVSFRQDAWREGVER